MRIIIIKGTAGIAEKKSGGYSRYVSRSAKDGIIDVDADQAVRLIDLGVAEKAESDLADLTISELKKIGEGKGISLKGCRTKADYIARIESAENADEIDSSDDQEDDSAPVFDASDVFE